MSELFDDIGTRPNARGDLKARMLPALMTTGVNAGGGMLAGRLDEYALKQWPNVPGAGPLLVGIMATGVRILLPGPGAGESIARELAGGMAGWAGDDLWYAIKDLLGFGVPTWEARKPYPVGAEVKWIGQTWIAGKEIPFPPQAEPGKDSRWVLHKAQGYKVVDLRGAAQAFLEDDRLVNAIASDHSEILGGELERMLGRHITPEERQQFADYARSTLQEVVGQFKAA